MNAEQERNERTGSDSPEEARIAEQATMLLEHCARLEGLSFDRALARRALHESALAIPGSGSDVWARRLVECGESLDLRIQVLDSRLQEAVNLVAAGHLVAAVRELPEKGFTWLLLEEVWGWRLKVVDASDGSRRWMSWRQLRRLIGITDSRSTGRFLYGQKPLVHSGHRGPVRGHGGAALGGHGSGSGGHDHHEEHLTPFRRLLAMMRPESTDLWTILVFSIVVGLLTLTTPIAVEALVNTVAFGRYLQPVLVLSLMVLAFLLFSATLTALVVVVVEFLQRRIFVRVVEDLAYRLPRIEQTALEGTNLSEQVNRFFDVMNIQKAAPKLLVDGLGAILQTLIGMAVLAFYHPFLLGFDILLLVLMVFAVFVLGRNAQNSAIGESICKYRTAAWLEEIASHPTAFRLNGGSHFALERADKLVVDYLDARSVHFGIVLRQYCVILGIYALAFTALLGLGGWLVIAGELTLGQLVASELIVALIVGSFVKIGKQLEVFYDLLASVDKIGHLLDLPIESHDRLFHLSEKGGGLLKLDRVTVGDGSHALLEEFTLELGPQERVAICGSAGSGKSLIADLVCGLRNPDSGSVQLDGVDLRELRPDAIREQIGVSRGVEIFAGTLDENVHLGRTEIRSFDVRNALNAVGLGETLARLPESLTTHLQTGGYPLTHSGAQRLMLARAMVRNPRLMVIDGSLDAMPLAEVQSILSGISASRNRPLLVLTARPEIAELCDRHVNLGGPGEMARTG